ncbi:hypothetical protein [Oceanithermus profundus]
MKTGAARSWTLLLVCLGAVLALAVRGQPADVPWPVDVAQTQVGYGFRFDQSVPRWQAFYPVHDSLRALALHVGVVGDPGKLIAEIRDAENAVLVRFVRAVRASGWVYLPFDAPLRVHPGRPYRIYVYADRPSPNPKQRFFWSGAFVPDFCPPCTTDVSGGRPGFRYAFVVYASR